MINTNEIHLIRQGIRFALQQGVGIGPGILNMCKESLAYNGYTWTEQHDKVLMEICVNISKEDL